MAPGGTARDPRLQAHDWKTTGKMESTVGNSKVKSPVIAGFEEEK